MIQVTASSVREIYFDSTRQDYFYKDDDTRVPEKFRDGYRTSVFRRSSSAKQQPFSEAEIQRRQANLAAAHQKFLKRIGRA